ncbi:MAG: hypothetical protein HKP30_06645 [Myxococcales bacterium]|nr:hypothetical protein [Myxococcales bacterium]
MVESKPFSVEDEMWGLAARAYFERAWRPARFLIGALAGAAGVLLLIAGIRVGFAVLPAVALWLMPLFAILAAWWFLPRLTLRRAIERFDCFDWFREPAVVRIDDHALVVRTQGGEDQTALLSDFTHAYRFDGSLCVRWSARGFIVIPKSAFQMPGDAAVAAEYLREAGVLVEAL